MLDLTKEQREKLVALRDEELALKRPNAAKVACIEKIIRDGEDVRKLYLVSGSEPHRDIGEVIEPKEAADEPKKA